MQENNNQANNRAKNNGRNKRRCSEKASNSTPLASVCGVIEDNAVFTEKLSGQHIKGYVNESETIASEKEDNSENISVKENDQSTQVENETEHSGPSFEETKVKQKRTLEVSLKKVPCKSEKIGQNVVSYSQVSASIDKKSIKAPKKGLLAKIKGFFSKLFSKKSSKKNSGKFNNDRSNRKNFSNGKRRNNFEKGKDGKGYRGNNNNRRKNYNRRPNGNYNKPKSPAQQANKE